MSNFIAEKIKAEDINRGNAYINGLDGIDASSLNKIVGAILYIQDFYKGLTEEEKNKLNKIITNGNGDKYLADNGEYKEVKGGTIVTEKDENGNVVELETFNADTKVDKLENDTDSTMLYAERTANGGTYLAKMSYTQANSSICVRSSTGYVRAQTPATGNDYDLTNRKFVKTYVDDAVKIYRHNIHCGNGGTEVWFTIDSKTIDTAFRDAEHFALWLSDGNEDKLPEFFVCRNTMDATYGNSGELYLNGTNLSIQQQEDLTITMSFNYAYSQRVSGVPISANDYMNGYFEDSVIEL